MKITANTKSNLKTVKKQLEPEGLPKRNTVPVQRLSSPPDPNGTTIKFVPESLEGAKMYILKSPGSGLCQNKGFVTKICVLTSGI